MGRLDELCDERGHVGDLYSELNKWSFESKWSPPPRSSAFACDFRIKRGSVNKVTALWNPALF